MRRALPRGGASRTPLCRAFPSKFILRGRIIRPVECPGRPRAVRHPDPRSGLITAVHDRRRGKSRKWPSDPRNCISHDARAGQRMHAYRSHESRERGAHRAPIDATKLSSNPRGDPREFSRSKCRGARKVR